MEEKYAFIYTIYHGVNMMAVIKINAERTYKLVSNILSITTNSTQPKIEKM